MRFLRVFLPTAALLLFGGADLFAQQEPPALLIWPESDGTHSYWFLVADDENNPVPVRITRIFTVGNVPVPPPDGDDTPPTPPPTSVETQVRGWTQEIDHAVGAQGLGLVYGTAAGQLESGNLPYAQAAKFVKDASDQVLSTLSAGTKWNGWRAKVGDLLTSKMQSGEVKDAATLAVFLRQVEKALKSATAEEPALDGILMKLLIEIIMRILTQLLGGGNVTPNPGPL